MLNAMVEEGCRKYEVLLLAADATRHLGGARLTNCMSGKDRTGMSATLEQARELVANNGFISKDAKSYPPQRTDSESRTLEQIACLEKHPASPISSSAVVQLANVMRVAGPRVHVCRKSIKKPKFKGSISLFCYKPPKHIAGDVEG